MADNNTTTQLTDAQKAQMFDLVMARIDQRNTVQPPAQNQRNLPANGVWSPEELERIHAASCAADKTFADHAVDAAVIGGGIVIGGATLMILAQIASAIFGSNK